VKRFREKERNVPRNGDETLLKRPQIAESETDTEQSRAEQGLAKLEELLRKAAGWENEPAPKLSVTGPIQALIDAGADLKADVLPVVKALAPNVQTRTSWAYFVKPIREAHQARIAAGRPINGNGKSSQVDWTTFTHRDYENAVDIAKKPRRVVPGIRPARSHPARPHGRRPSAHRREGQALRPIGEIAEQIVVRLSRDQLMSLARRVRTMDPTVGR
jgi:hypothetical protein